MINNILEIAFSGFWEFIGMVMLIGMVLKTIAFFWQRLTRTVMVLVRGWSPEHLDADGDWKKEAE